ncbi:nucleoside hydrolase [Mycolicibacter terrae]|uniref:Nucleoside hydrolase n=1 Tax=Mycolicibacter terrae TaxID=1788 RepID=A0AAD1HUM1_9MYCO|nr:nucleoside hydrolase [Mycolicibacter terrae]ORW91341.1 nucleoside hydrolase [Mycolicibacter terrae]BBX21444.1 nucleoside hydrolase [Mycolicibacter terrae]SNV88847.1 inosine-uridine nucleoside hydrolase IunH [Mycolicibacter terrae]
MTLPVFADVDTGVDDAVALVYLLASPDAELVGLACTGGNVAVQQVCRNNLALLELCGAPGIPVSKGAEAPLNGPVHTAETIHGPQGLGYAELPSGAGRLTGHDAAAAWVAAAEAHPGQLIGLATGPLTNLALALRAEPALPTLLRRLVIMGGAFSGERAGRPEFNIGFDPEAAAEVLTSWVAVAPQRLPIVCGLDLTRQIAITPAILALLPAPADSPVVRLLDDALRFYFEAHEGRGHGYLAYLHDPLAAAIALEPELVTTRPAAVQVELSPTAARGRTIPDWDAELPNALIGVGVDPTAFFDRFVQRVGALARRLG